MWNWPSRAQRKQDLWLLWNASGLVQHSSCQYKPCVFIGNMCQHKTAFKAAAERWASPGTADLFFCLWPKPACYCCPSCSSGRTNGKNLHSKEIVAIQVCTDRKRSYCFWHYSLLHDVIPTQKTREIGVTMASCCTLRMPRLRVFIRVPPWRKAVQQASPYLSWMSRGAFGEDLPVICSVLLPMGCHNTLKAFWIINLGIFICITENSE